MTDDTYSLNYERPNASTRTYVRVITSYFDMHTDIGTCIHTPICICTHVRQQLYYSSEKDLFESNSAYGWLAVGMGRST